jgi:1,3-beta-glucan synthase
MLLQQQRPAAALAAGQQRQAPVAAPKAATASARRPSPRRRAAPIVRAAAAEESFGDAVKRVAKRVQGALPVIGLLSRLTTPEGGFDGQGNATYAEFSRGVYDDPARYPAYATAASELEKRHGRPANPRHLLLALWMADQGAGGLVAPRDVVAAMRRLRVTGDMEIEIDRFLGARDAALQKYSMVAREPASAQARAELGVDALTAVAVGLKDGAALEEADAEDVAAAVGAALSVPVELTRAAAAVRAERSLALASAAASAKGAAPGSKA